MAELGTQCIRCRERAVRPRREGLLVCETCEAELRRNRERIRACPVDGSDLEKEIVAAVVIDRCAECGGIWLDEGELRLILEASKLDGFLTGFAHTLSIA